MESFKTYTHPEPDMQGARLWVKRDDWMALFGRANGESSALKAATCTSSEPRKKPGPSPNQLWPEVVAKVTRDCMSAGYRLPLARGERAAIGTMLLAEMAKKDLHFSDDTARKYAAQVISALGNEADR